MKLPLIKFLFILWIFTGLVQGLYAYVASSTNYRLRADSINFTGGTSSSTNFKAQDTLGEDGSGMGTSTSYNLRAGYQFMQPDTYVTVSSPADVAMSPGIDGVAGGASNGSASWTVVTNNAAGYSLSIRALTSPALKSGSNGFSDYVPSHADPDFDWTLGTNESRFGFTPEGFDIVTKYRDNGAGCGVGSADTVEACWDGLSTANRVVARGTSPNELSGMATTLKFRAGVGVDKNQMKGTYVADIVVTAVAI